MNIEYKGYTILDGADGFDGVNIYNDRDQLVKQVPYAGDVTSAWDRAIEEAKKHIDTHLG